MTSQLVSVCYFFVFFVAGTLSGCVPIIGPILGAWICADSDHSTEQAADRWIPFVLGVVSTAVLGTIFLAPYISGHLIPVSMLQGVSVVTGATVFWVFYALSGVAANIR